MTTNDALDAGLAESSLPRSNGTLVFAEPWQGRAFAITVLAVERTGRVWDDFRRGLITAIADDPDRPYWDSWVTALERFVDQVIPSDEVPSTEASEPTASTAAPRAPR